MNEPNREMEEVKALVKVTERAVAEIVEVNSENLAFANKWAVELRAIEKKIDTYWDPLIEKAKDAKKKAEDSRKALANEKDRMKQPVESARRGIELKISKWAQQEEQRRRIENEKARKKAQEEEDNFRLQMAQSAEEIGDRELANEILDAVEQVPPAAVATPTVKETLQGLTPVDHWYAEVINPHKIVQAWLEGKTPPDIVQINLARLNSHAKNMQNRFDIPGAIAKKEIRMRGAR